MTDDLIAWLRAWLNADESDAKAFLSNVPDDSGAADWMRQILVDIDAKRRILDLHATYPGTSRLAWYCQACREQVAPCPTARLLALPYADRPGYRAEWGADR